MNGVHSSAVGCGTALQTGRSRIRFTLGSLRFFVKVILPGSTKRECLLEAEVAGGRAENLSMLHVPIF